MSKFAASLAVAAVLLSASAIAETAKPTVVLVHGAFADSSSWNGVTRILQKDGYNVVAAANPLRSVSGDAAYVSSVVNNIKGPVVLVGHSYGGQVIT
ncbi:TPA: alpha/beta hydrolase, partial [Enterobacter kobei]|nr:alpha/beta hydrolase [Enterobacter kobei]